MRTLEEKGQRGIRHRAQPVLYGVLLQGGARVVVAEHSGAKGKLFFFFW